MSQSTKLPSGRIGRLVRMAQLGARTGSSFCSSRDGSGAAAQAAEVLGTMRGLAAKVGQMASYVDGSCPRSTARRTRRALKRPAARPRRRSSPEAIRALVEEELGAPIDELFAEWSDRADRQRVDRPGAPRAARRRPRGRGQGAAPRHRARGRERPRATAASSRAASAMLGPRELNAQAALLDEIAQRFREELDYEPRGRAPALLRRAPRRRSATSASRA